MKYLFHEPVQWRWKQVKEIYSKDISKFIGDEISTKEITKL